MTTSGRPSVRSRTVSYPTTTHEAAAPEPKRAKIIIPLPMGRDSISRLRNDATSARTADSVPQRHGPAPEEPVKRLTSGFNLTIKDSVTVMTQWPQMNVYRTANKAATYDSLSVNEFCNGYLLHVLNCLMHQYLMLLQLLIISII